MTGAHPTRQRQEVTPVYSVDTQQRLASASVVFFGHYGDVTRLAQQRDLCRQSLYREAPPGAPATEGIDPTQHIQQLQETIGRLQLEVDTLRQQLRLAVTIDSDRQAEFASVSAPEGVSLPLAHRLLHILLKERTPSVPQLGRWS